MSYQEVGQKIKVLAVFKNGTIFPYVFEWNGRRHRVDKVNLSYQEREGSSINYYFAVEASTDSSAKIKAGMVAKLKYNDKSMLWSIEEVWEQ